jgi:hypothetical protein
MKKGVRLVDIGWGGVVSYYAQRCMEHGSDPDVDELERYNQAAKKNNCPHDRRSKVVHDDDYATESWYCLDCTSPRVDQPTSKDGTFDLGGYVWRRHEKAEPATGQRWVVCSSGCETVLGKKSPQECSGGPLFMLDEAVACVRGFEHCSVLASQLVRQVADASKPDEEKKSG